MGQILDIAITRPFGLVLMAIYNFVGSYGLSIVLFTILTKLLMLPITLKQKQSMQAMSAIQPKMTEIQKKYKNNQAKMNEEIQKLYDREGVNPMSGCLPMFITFPIMICLYYVVQKPLTFMMGLPQSVIADMANTLGVAMDGNSVLVEIEIASKAFHQADLFTGIAGFVPMDFTFLGINLAAAPEFSHPSVLWLVPILSGASAFLSSYVMQKLQSTTAAPQNQSMKTMLYIMPLFSVWIGFSLPTALGVYWITSSVVITIQELALTAYMKHLNKKKAQNSQKN